MFPGHGGLSGCIVNEGSHDILAAPHRVDKRPHEREREREREIQNGTEGLVPNVKGAHM